MNRVVHVTIYKRGKKECVVKNKNLLRMLLRRRKEEDKRKWHQGEKL